MKTTKAEIELARLVGVLRLAQHDPDIRMLGDLPPAIWQEIKRLNVAELIGTLDDDLLYYPERAQNWISDGVAIPTRPPRKAAKKSGAKSGKKSRKKSAKKTAKKSSKKAPPKTGEPKPKIANWSDLEIRNYALAKIQNAGSMQISQVLEATGANRGRVGRLLDAMAKEGVIRRQGKGRGTYYVPPLPHGGNGASGNPQFFADSANDPLGAGSVP